MEQNKPSTNFKKKSYKPLATPTGSISNFEFRGKINKVLSDFKNYRSYRPPSSTKGFTRQDQIMKIKVKKVESESVVKRLLSNDDLMKKYSSKKYERMREDIRAIDDEKKLIKNLKI